MQQLQMLSNESSHPSTAKGVNALISHVISQTHCLILILITDLYYLTHHISDPLFNTHPNNRFILNDNELGKIVLYREQLTDLTINSAQRMLKDNFQS